MERLAGSRASYLYLVGSRHKRPSRVTKQWPRRVTLGVTFPMWTDPTQTHFQQSWICFTFNIIPVLETGRLCRNITVRITYSAQICLSRYLHSVSKIAAKEVRSCNKTCNYCSLHAHTSWLLHPKQERKNREFGRQK